MKNPKQRQRKNNIQNKKNMTPNITKHLTENVTETVCVCVGETECPIWNKLYIRPGMKSVIFQLLNHMKGFLKPT